MTTEAIFLNKSFDTINELITNNPDNADNLINDYINIIIKIKSDSQSNKLSVRTATFKDDNDNKTGTIKIHNNFQKYGYNSILNPPSYDNQQSSESFNEYFNTMKGGFKDYMKL